LPNPDAEHNPNVATTQLFVLSASTEKALAALSQNLREWIETHELTAQALRDLSYTLAVHRSALSYRRSILASTGETLAAELDQSINPKRAMSLAPLTFVFSGQGAQWHAMGRELMSLPGHFRDSISSMDSVLRQQGSRWSLADELSKTAETSRIDEAEISQPATTAIQIALVDLLGSLSIRPSRVVGHSSGEIAAAYAAGALSRDSAIIV
jgi:acyl transferase domain-containing protein